MSARLTGMPRTTRAAHSACSVCRPDAPSTPRAGNPYGPNSALSFSCWAATPDGAGSNSTNEAAGTVGGVVPVLATNSGDSEKPTITLPRVRRPDDSSPAQNARPLARVADLARCGTRGPRTPDRSTSRSGHGTPGTGRRTGTQRTAQSPVEAPDPEPQTTRVRGAKKVRRIEPGRLPLVHGGIPSSRSGARQQYGTKGHDEHSCSDDTPHTSTSLARATDHRGWRPYSPGQPRLERPLQIGRAGVPTTPRSPRRRSVRVSGSGGKRVETHEVGVGVAANGRQIAGARRGDDREQLGAGSRTVSPAVGATPSNQRSHATGVPGVG